MNIQRIKESSTKGQRGLRIGFPVKKKKKKAATLQTTEYKCTKVSVFSCPLSTPHFTPPQKPSKSWEHCVAINETSPEHAVRTLDAKINNSGPTSKSSLAAYRTPPRFHMIAARGSQ